MSEQKLVSPLLDGFQMGDPISSHDGVRCCPAIRENSDNKYIVKILSIPASQSQLDALLLAGAFQDAAGALEYFKDLADGVIKEIKLHQQLALVREFNGRILRNAVRSQGQLKAPVSYADKYSHPDALISLLKANLPKGKLEPMLIADNEAPEMVVQVNTLRITTAALMQQLCCVL